MNLFRLGLASLTLSTLALATGPGHTQGGVEVTESGNSSTINWVRTKEVDFNVGLEGSAGSDYLKVGADGKKRAEADSKPSAKPSLDTRIWNAKGDEQKKEDSAKEQPMSPTRELKVGGAYTDADGSLKNELREFKVDANNNVWTHDGVKVLNAQGNQAKVSDVENVIRNDQGVLKFGGTTFAKPKVSVGG